MKNCGPLRAVVSIQSGAVTLSCGHLAESNYRQKQPTKKHCLLCLPLEARQKLISDGPLRARLAKLRAGLKRISELQNYEAYESRTLALGLLMRDEVLARRKKR
jgi:hypothetical protein